MRAARWSRAWRFASDAHAHTLDGRQLDRSYLSARSCVRDANATLQRVRLVLHCFRLVMLRERRGLLHECLLNPRCIEADRAVIEPSAPRHTARHRGVLPSLPSVRSRAHSEHGSAGPRHLWHARIAAEPRGAADCRSAQVRPPMISRRASLLAELSCPRELEARSHRLISVSTRRAPGAISCAQRSVTGAAGGSARHIRAEKRRLGCFMTGLPMAARPLTAEDLRSRPAHCQQRGAGRRSTDVERCLFARSEESLTLTRVEPT